MRGLTRFFLSHPSGLFGSTVEKKALFRLFSGENTRLLRLKYELSLRGDPEATNDWS